MMEFEMLKAVERPGLVRRTMVRFLVTRDGVVPTDGPAYGGA